MKSMLLAQVLIKKCRSLHKSQDAHESKNQEELDYEVLQRFRCSFTMNVVPIVPSAKGLGSESSLCLLYYLRPGGLGLVLLLNHFALRFGVLSVNLPSMILLLGITEYFYLAFCGVVSSLIQCDQACDNYSTHRYYSPFLSARFYL